MKDLSRKKGREGIKNGKMVDQVERKVIDITGANITLRVKRKLLD